ncbi:hypothetical protein [Nocardia cyriacigeorgica]|uniref:hypothetical protein n=1 Tax=Nocardia cyriacigeorgica TaxID=135487 RepID=UPI002458C856|nr:hypothetical protein [Nocardia cyriacigeorgica]
MADVSFPAHITVDEQPDLDGNPIITATIVPSETSATLPLPGGDPGPPGLRGTPRSMFVKMGEIANEAARPAGLGADDRGKWWHRLDTNGMDVWTGTEWKHSPNAVGPKGPVAAPNTLTVTTTHDERLTIPAVKFTGNGADQHLEVTVPAGEQGPPGPPGTSGAITTATDFDDTTGPTQRSMFGLNVGARRWRVLPPPTGFGPWAWYESDFNPDLANQSTNLIVAGEFTVPALPFVWRPLVFAHMYAACDSDVNADAVCYVRLGSSNGVMVATGSGARIDSAFMRIPVIPAYGDEGTKPLSPASTFATVPANTETKLVATVERAGATNSSAKIGWDNAGASLVVWALPA